MATRARLRAQRRHNATYREGLKAAGRPTRAAVATALLNRALATYPEAVLEAAHGLCRRGYDDTEVLCLLAGMVAQAKAARADVDTKARADAA